MAWWTGCTGSKRPCGSATTPFRPFRACPPRRSSRRRAGSRWSAGPSAPIHYWYWTSGYVYRDRDRRRDLREGEPERGNGKGEGGLVVGIRAPYKGLKRGESVAVNGACLTVERVVRGGFTAHAVETTLGRTLLGEWVAGRPVNLERAVRAIDRLGGHLVQGHVDGVAGVTRVTKQGDAVLVDLQVPPEVL